MEVCKSRVWSADCEDPGYFEEHSCKSPESVDISELAAIEIYGLLKVENYGMSDLEVQTSLKRTAIMYLSAYYSRYTVEIP